MFSSLMTAFIARCSLLCGFASPPNDQPYAQRGECTNYRAQSHRQPDARAAAVCREAKEMRRRAGYERANGGHASENDSPNAHHAAAHLIRRAGLQERVDSG